MPQLSLKRHKTTTLVASGLLCALAMAPAPVFGHGGFHERMEELATKVEQDPNNAQWHFELADLNAQHGDWQLALLNLDRAEQLAPGQYMVQLLRGQAWLVGEQPEKAKKALDAVLAEHPEVTRAWLYRARALKWLGDVPASLADFREVLRRSPVPEPDLVLEVAEYMAAQKQEKEAEQVLVAGMAKLGPVPSLVLRAMDLEIAAKNFDAALQRVEEMRKTAPRPEPWMAKRASVLAQAGRLDESRAAWEALAQHLLALPNLERGSHAMSKLMEETRLALDSLASIASPPKPNPSPATPPHP